MYEVHVSSEVYSSLTFYLLAYSPGHQQKHFDSFSKGLTRAGSFHEQLNCEYMVKTISAFLIVLQNIACMSSWHHENDTHDLGVLSNQAKPNLIYLKSKFDTR